MKRREFLGGIGLGAAATLLIPNSAGAGPQLQRIDFAKGLSGNPRDVRIAVKPVFSPLIHTDVWEGPCRASAEKPEKERANAIESFNRFSRLLNVFNGNDFRMLEPAMVEYSEDFWIRPEELAKLEPDREQTDVYLIGPAGMYNYAATVIGETFKKPVVIVGEHFISADGVAGLNALGLEGHTVFYDFQKLAPLLSLLNTRKVFQQTNILIVTDRDLPPIPVQSCITDMAMLRDKFGIGSHFVSYREFAAAMDDIIGSREWRSKAEDRAEQMVRSAGETHIDKKYVQRSVEFYYAVKNLMQKYGCNAFTVECFELCASRLAEKYRITPCLVHTLLKDEGIASACESDLNALLGMRLLMSASNRSSFMGNPLAIAKDRIFLYHSVPGLKMAGYDKPDLPYHLRHFVKSGWGAKVMVDFAQLEEKTVTLARLDSTATRIYLGKGEIVDCTGFRKGVPTERLEKAKVAPSVIRWLKEMDESDLIGCTLAAHIQVPDAPGSMQKLSGFGSHLSMVYGDWTQEVRDLADMMGLEVVYAT